MRYLKKYNESFRAPSEFREEIQEFCEGYLAYLMDEDFNVQVSLYNLDPVSVSFVLIRRISSQIEPIPFSWNDVKDHYIPFLEMLQRRYDLAILDGVANMQVVIRPTEESRDSVYYTLHEVLEDKINPYDKIVYIRILITEK